MSTTGFGTAGGKRSLETTIGLFWLHRLGITSLVFGIVFLIMSSFQYFGPIEKLMTGFAVSLSLIFLGRTMAKKDQRKWFAHGLTAGGWSLAYFTTYAAYYLPAVSVVTSLPLETLLLLAVASGSLMSALRARSQLMSIFSVSLASASIIMSGPSLLSDISFLFIAFTTAFLGNRMSWRKLFCFGMAACYVGHLYCGASAITQYDSSIASVFLSGMWLVFSIGLGYSEHGSTKSRGFTTTMSCLNAIAFVAGLLIFSGRGLPELCQALLASGGAVYLAAARWLFKRKEEQLSSVHSLLGLSMINLAKTMHFSGLTLLSLDLMEITLLASVGAKYNVRAFRWFALFLTLLLFPVWVLNVGSTYEITGMGFHCLPYVKLGLSASLILGVLAVVYRNKGSQLALPRAYSHFYYVAANIILSMSLANLEQAPFLVLAFVAQAVANNFMALFLDEPLYVYPAVINGYIAGLILSQDSNWNTIALQLTIALLYFAHAFNRILVKRRAALSKSFSTKELAALLTPVYSVIANLILTLFILKQVQTNYISPALAAEGIALLVVGFLMNDKLFRVCGLIVLAALTGKLFLVDFAKFNTIERVSSFTVAGVVFLLSSYGYARFTRSFDDELQAESPPEDADEAGTLPAISMGACPAEGKTGEHEQPFGNELSHDFNFEI